MQHDSTIANTILKKKLHTACECNTIFFSCVCEPKSHRCMLLFVFSLLLLTYSYSYGNCIHRTNFPTRHMHVHIYGEEGTHAQKKIFLLLQLQFFFVCPRHIFIFLK